MDKSYRMTEAALVLAVLESVSRYLENEQALTEQYSLDENAVTGGLGKLRDDVKEVIRLYREDPEAFGQLGTDAVKNGYRDILNLVKKALKKGGYTVTGKNPLSGLPTIQKTSEVQDDRTRAEIRRRITAAAPKLTGGFQENGGQLFREDSLDGKCGYSCSVIGELVGMIQSMDGSQLSVTQTGESRFGTPDSPLVETTFFITLPESETV